MENNAERGNYLYYPRYQERFDSSTETSNWSFEEERLLFALHN
jgi:hypothetical protein